MSQYRQHSPRAAERQSEKKGVQRFNKSYQESPLNFGQDSHCKSNKQASTNYESDDGEDCHFPLQHRTTSEQAQRRAKQETERAKQEAERAQELADLRKKLMKEEEKNYIFQQFFRKLEKILYNENSEHLEGGEIKNYEKLEMHLMDMSKRIEKGSNYSKLEAVPVIYRKDNCKVTKVVYKR